MISAKNISLHNCTYFYRRKSFSELILRFHLLLMACSHFNVQQIYFMRYLFLNGIVGNVGLICF